MLLKHVLMMHSWLMEHCAKILVYPTLVSFFKPGHRILVFVFPQICCEAAFPPIHWSLLA